MKLKVGVIGAGHLGKLHMKMLNNIENAELIGIYDLNSEQAEKAATEYNTKVYTNLEDLFNNVDAVSIVTTTSAHYQVMKEAIKHNLPILVEKPITATIEEAEEVVNLAKEKDLILQVGHIERFNPALLSLDKYNLDPKFIQSDRLAQFNPRGTDVAVVLDLMIHDIDIILSLVKSEVKDVHASGIAVVSDTIDIANARIEFENGAVANVTASRISQKRMRKMRMFQKDAYITLDFNSGVSEIYRLMSQENIPEKNFISFGEIGIGDRRKYVVYEQPEQLEVNALRYEIELFVNSVINKIKPVVSGLDGLKALKVAQKIILKIEEQKIL
jgi:predicted dehydrogenase